LRDRINAIRIAYHAERGDCAMRERILEEIRRWAAAHGGLAPDAQEFESATGIGPAAWNLYWTDWNDALAEARPSPTAKEPLDEALLFTQLAAAFRQFGRIPTEAEMRVYRRGDATLPSHTAVLAHFRSKVSLLERFAAWAGADPVYADVALMLQARPVAGIRGGKTRSADTGVVYLMQAGKHYKIGRSEEIERRPDRMPVALPPDATLVHAIRTDDPPGIEAYWRRRFADRRTGSSFALTTSDIAAFRRRRYQ
jgi:hypothetical protein